MWPLKYRKIAEFIRAGDGIRSENYTGLTIKAVMPRTMIILIVWMPNAIAT